MIDTRRLNFGAWHAIVALLGTDARLREIRKGQFFARCLFHDDSTASLSLTMRDDRGWVFNCFGCGESGDAIGFVMRSAKVDFKGAVAIIDKGDLALPPPAFEVKKKYVLICDACRDEHIPIDVEDIPWLTWEVAPDAIGAVGPRCLGERVMS